MQKVGEIDFDKFYTPHRRLFLHLAMWAFFFTLLFLNYSIEFKLEFLPALLLTVRAIVNNAIVFYFFFVLYRHLFTTRILLVNTTLAVFGLYICIVIWLLSNYLQFLALYSLGIEINGGMFDGVIARNVERGLTEAISFETVAGNANTVIFSFAPPFLVKVLFDITRLYNRTLQVQKQKTELEIRNVNIEKDFLKSQLNPHFLFNTLNNLYGLTIKKDTRASDVVLSLSDVMGYTLYESNAEKVPLLKELEFIRNYFELEKMRHPDGMTIVSDIICDEGTAETLSIAPLLTFTFIENAFKYGLKNKERSFLRMSVKVENSTFHFTIENDKPSDNAELVASDLSGIGIDNAEKRLLLLYPDMHELCIEEGRQMFRVSLKINL